MHLTLRATALIVCIGLISCIAVATPQTLEPEIVQEDEVGQSAALDHLFESLKDAQAPEIARGIEQLIWSIWLTAGNDDADLLMSLSIDAMSRQDFAQARTHLDALIKLEPDLAEGWNKRATIYYIEGDYPSSLADIKQTLRLEPRHFGALSGLGMILEQMGQKEGALKAYREALALNPYMPAIESRAQALSLEVEGPEL
jgi:tetratricopeptide (TPR) repeat protein